MAEAEVSQIPNLPSLVRYVPLQVYLRLCDHQTHEF